MSQWPTFPRKAAIAPDDLMVQGKECTKCVFQANAPLNYNRMDLSMMFKFIPSGCYSFMHMFRFTYTCELLSLPQGFLPGSVQHAT